MADISNNTAMAVLSSLVPNSHQILLCRNPVGCLVNALRHRISAGDSAIFTMWGRNPEDALRYFHDAPEFRGNGV